jgi:methionine-rich copper-binding protein CopC
VALDANLVLTFDEAVKAGTGFITIRNADGSVRETVNVADATRVTFSGNTLTVDPQGSFAAGAKHHVIVDAGAVIDLAGNAFAQALAVDLTAMPPVDTKAPALLTRTPADDAANVALNANLVLTFDEAVRAGSGKLVIYDAAGAVYESIDIRDATKVTIAGSVVTVNPANDFKAGSGHHVLIDPGALTDLAGNAFAGVTDKTSYNFTAAGGTAPPPSGTGTNGNDTLTGTSGNDTLNG